MGKIQTIFRRILFDVFKNFVPFWKGKVREGSQSIMRILTEQIGMPGAKCVIVYIEGLIIFEKQR